MKNNLILFGVLVFLLVGTYIFYEKPQHDHNHAFDHQQVVKKEDIKTLAFKDIDAKLIGQQWKVGEKLLSYNQMNQILEVLDNVAILREIEINAPEENYFKKKIDLKVNGIHWSIGDFNLDQTMFYFKRDGKLFLATFEGEMDEIIREDENPYVKRMNLLTHLLESNVDDLKEVQLFRHYPKLPVGNVTIESEGRPKFSLDLDDNSTDPLPFQGIEIHEDLLSKFYTFLTQITIKEEVDYPLSFSGIDLGKIIFSKNNERVEWKIKLKSKSSADVFLVDDESQKAFQIIGGTLKILFLSVQDFWDKKVISPKDFTSFKKLPVKLIQGEKEGTFSILNREPLKFEAQNYSVDETNFNKILHLIFNLSQFDQADRVSPLSPTEKKIIQNQSLLKVLLFGQELMIWKKAQEIIVVNLTRGLKFHFFNTDESFPTKFEDVLK